MFLLLQFFLSGFALGMTTCSLHSSILLAPLVAKESSSWRGGFKIGIWFGVGRILVYGTLGGIVSHLGYFIKDILLMFPFRLIAGIILLSLGIWFLFPSKKCKSSLRALPPFLLGLTEAVIPCAPLLGFLFYLAYIKGGFFFGFLCGALFGLGSIISLVLVVCGMIPYFWQKVCCFSKANIILRIIGFAILSFWSITIIFS